MGLALGISPVFGGKSGLITPDKIPNLVDWYRSDLGLSLSGSNVTGWASQSGSGRSVTQATGSLQPIWNATSGSNNLPGITFDGVDDFLSGTFSPLDGLTEYTMFVVAKHTADGVAVNATNDQIGDQTYSGSRLARFGGTLGAGFGGFTEALSAYHYITYQYDGTQTGSANRLIAFEDGVQETLDFTIYTVSPALPTAGTLYIGKYNLGAFNFSGVLQEIAIYSRKLTVGERQSNESYFKSRYAL